VKVSTETQLRTGFVPVHDGTKLYYEMAGAGPYLILLHAGIADSRMWDAQIEFFSKSHRVLRYDMRGFGQSPASDADFAHHQDLHDLLRYLNITRCHLIGVSLGASTALNFVLAYPAMVHSLVLVASREGLEKPSDALQQAWVDIDAIVKKGNVTEAVEMELRLWVDGPRRTPAPVRSRVRELIREMNANNFAIPPGKGKSIALEPPVFNRLEEIRAPTLVISATEDIPDVLASAEKLTQRINGAQKVLIPDAAHMVSMEKPEEFNQSVLMFLKNLSR
jgi:pimeloyl-ACP methyl ester carboxylesterase